VSFQKDFTTALIPIYKIIYLRKVDADTKLSTTTKQGMEAFQVLFSQLYRTSMITSAQRQTLLFERLNHVLNQAPLIEIIRPEGGNTIKELTQLIEREIQ